VVDCGGGTVDITAHEMESTRGDLHEIFKATGGPHGSVGLSASLSVCLSLYWLCSGFVCLCLLCCEY